MSIRAVIWDFGGVLMRTENRQPREQLAQRLGMSLAELEALVYESETAQMAQRGEIEPEQHYLSLGEKLHLESVELEAFFRQFWAGDVLDHALLEYIRTLKGRYRIGLLSNAFGNLRGYLNDVLKIDTLFDHIVISAEVGITKPNPKIYFMALEGLGVSPPEAVFIDDFEGNVLVAQQLGMHAIRFDHPQRVRHQLASLLEVN